MTRVINTNSLIPIIENLVKKACYELDDNLVDAFKGALCKEESPIGRDTIKILIDNTEYAKNEQLACCHDTGTCVVIVEAGEQVSWEGDSLKDCINQGVRQGYKNGNLRFSIVGDPLERVNTNDNTPAVIHTDIVPGDKVKITVMPKGGGSENMGAFRTLLPGQGIEGVKEFLIETVKRAGGNPCPPYLIGIGIGGTMDHCSWMAKKALLRPIGQHNKKPLYENLEKELMQAVNDTGIGPLGMGGSVTALAVNIEYHGCHITALPVAINFQCNASRHAEEII